MKKVLLQMEVEAPEGLNVAQLVVDYLQSGFVHHGDRLEQNPRDREARLAMQVKWGNVRSFTEKAS